LVIDMLNSLNVNNKVSLIIVNNIWDKVLLEKLDKNIPVYFINRKEGSPNPIPVLRLNLLLKRINPDVIHCHSNKMIKVLLFRFKTLYTVHDVGTNISEVTKYSRIVAISRSVAEYIENTSEVKPTIIFNGVDFDKFRRKKTYSLDSGEPVKLIQISRLIHKKKGQDIIINVLKKMVLSGNENITLDIVGSGESLDYLLALTKELELEASVNFLGNQDRDWVKQNLCNYDILIQPSRYEGFGLTVVEGVAAGLPVVASNIEGPAEIFSGIEESFLFRSEDIDDCFNVLNRVITLYKNNKMEQIMQATHTRLENRFSLAESMSDYEILYENMIS